jgi:hypothetical protein
VEKIVGERVFREHAQRRIPVTLDYQIEALQILPNSVQEMVTSIQGDRTLIDTAADLAATAALLEIADELGIFGQWRCLKV